jgi:hypothetical protein
MLSLTNIRTELAAIGSSASDQEVARLAKAVEELCHYVGEVERMAKEADTRAKRSEQPRPSK